MKLCKAFLYSQPYVDLASWVGLVPSQFNMLNGQNFALAPASSLPPGGWAIVTGADGPVASVTSNLVGPDTKTTASKLIEGFDNAGLGRTNIHRLTSPSIAMGQGFGELDNVHHRLQVIAKAAERTRIVIGVNSSGGDPFDSGNRVTVGFDLAGGNVGYDNVASGWTILSASMTSLGNGWWLCQVDFNPGAFTWVASATRIAIDKGSGTAARDITYSGNGTSGVLLWYAVLLPLCAYTQFSSEVFHDDFTSLSTIDMNNTRVDGFNWYLQTSWPATGAGGCWQLGHPTPASTVSQTGSVMTLARDQSTSNNTGDGGGCGNTMASAAASASDPSVVVGRQFLYPAIVEACFAVKNLANLGAGTLNGSYPAFWCFTAGVHKGTYGVVGDNFGYENDFTDVYGSGATPGIYHVNTSQSPSLIPPVGIVYEAGLGGGANFGSVNITDFRQCAYMLVRPDATTGNRGFSMSFQKTPSSNAALTSMFVSGVVSRTWTNSVGAPDGGGLYYTDPFYLILGAGWGRFDPDPPGGATTQEPLPSAWDWVRVIN